MKLPVLATTVLLAAAFALAAFPTADADTPRCPPPQTGVKVEGPTGPVGMCCDFTQDPSPCYTWWG